MADLLDQTSVAKKVDDAPKPVFTPPPRRVNADPWGSDNENNILGNVVLQQQMRTAVYWNTHGALVIRQEAPDHWDADPLVCIRPEHVPALIAAMQKAMADG